MGNKRKKYRISKIGINKGNPLSEYSYFGDSATYFEGYSEEGPKQGSRFQLRDSTGWPVISTSPVVEVSDKEIITTYSRYSIEEV